MFSDMIGKPVMLQLRNQPYIGVTGTPMQPAVSEDGFMTTPLIQGILREIEGKHFTVETTDPDRSLNNKVYITVSLDDIGMITRIEAPLLVTV
jgi:hypothetical protein